MKKETVYEINSKLVTIKENNCTWEHSTRNYPNKTQRGI